MKKMVANESEFVKFIFSTWNLYNRNPIFSFPEYSTVHRFTYRGVDQIEEVGHTVHCVEETGGLGLDRDPSLPLHL